MKLLPGLSTMFYKRVKYLEPPRKKTVSATIPPQDTIWTIYSMKFLLNVDWLYYLFFFQENDLIKPVDQLQ